MNFMSGRSGFCEEIAASTPIITSSSSPNFNFRGIPSDAGEAAAAAATAGDDSDDHVRGEEGGSGNSRGTVIEREHMFDKVVTPSDVGKLNRLVIPKQHAEKYFPLDSSSNEKGLLLNFEDRNGKPWRFRYSYWNSSQSYVMTKGWSRFVKEKKLDAGDIVSFQRGVGESARDRLFIDWRHRPDVPEIPPPLSMPTQFSFHRSSIHPWSPLFLPPPPPSSRDYSHFLHPAAAIPTPNHHYHNHHHHAISNYAYNSNNGNPYSPAAGSIMYLRSTPGGSAAGGLFGGQQYGAIGQTTAETRGSRTVEQMVLNAVPVVQGKGAAKRLRLFGVNMECPIPDESDDGCDIVLSSTTHPPPPTISLHHLPPSPFDTYPPPSSSITPRLNPSTHSDDDNKGKASMSLDLDI